MAPSSSITIVEVPTEAGTHWAGQSQAPEAFKRAGLQSRLEELGYDVQTLNALPDGPARWKPTKLVDGVYNEGGGLAVAVKVRECLEDLLKQDDSNNALTFPIIIGGDCSITPGVMAAFRSHLSKREPHSRLGLLYVDNDIDLALPEESGNEPGARSGILDSMTFTHLTARQGGLNSMKAFSTADSPLVTPTNTVAIGLDVTAPSPVHFAYLLDHHFRVLTAAAVKRDPVAASRAALDYLREQNVDRILLHWDTDVIDSGMFPIGNYPSYGGIEVDQVLAVIKTCISDARVVGVTITEVNPDYDKDGSMLQKLTDGLVEAMESRIKS